MMSPLLRKQDGRCLLWLGWLVGWFVWVFVCFVVVVGWVVVLFCFILLF